MKIIVTNRYDYENEYSSNNIYCENIYDFNKNNFKKFDIYLFKRISCTMIFNVLSIIKYRKNQFLVTYYSEFDVKKEKLLYSNSNTLIIVI